MTESKLEISFLNTEDNLKVEEFWNFFDCYIDELADVNNPLDLDYFHSDEYKQTIISLSKRQKNPL